LTDPTNMKTRMVILWRIQQIWKLEW